MIKHKMTNYMMALISSVIMGSMGLFTRHISADTRIITLFRLGISSLLLLALLHILGKERKSFRWHWSIVSGGILTFMCMYCYMKSTQLIDLSTAVFLVYLGPIVAIVAAKFLLKEQMGPLQRLAVLFSFAGAICLLEGKINLSNNHGVILGFTAAILYGFNIITNKKIPDDVSEIHRSFSQLAIAFAISLPFALPGILTNGAASFQSSDLPWLLGIGVFHGFIGITFFICALKKLAVHEFVPISFIETIVATILGVSIYAEQLSWMKILGCLLILTSNLLPLLPVMRPRSNLALD